MDTLSRIAFAKNISRVTLSLAAAAGLFLTTATRADEPLTMAPPVETTTPYATDSDFDSSQATGGDASADSVFNWREIPANQQVPLTRAAFDKGGYQLYDTAGETIVVPFTNQNLYVMKFAQSDNGTMYFVNAGTVPILYVPRDGYLENAAVSGTRWYPLGQDFHPAEPVFLGVAPSWPEFIDMGWYPDMCYYGGYWGRTSFVEAGVFLPTAGLFFEIGGTHYYGWHGYRSYVVIHPAPYRLGYYNRDYYRWADRSRGSLRPFGGVDHRYYAHQAFAGTRGFGGDHSFGGNRGVGEAHSFGGSRGFNDNRSFGGNRGFNASHPVSGGRVFRGAAGFLPDRHGDDHSFNGGQNHDNHSFNGGQNHNAPAFNGTQNRSSHSFGGVQNRGDHPFGGTQARNDRTFGSGQPAEATHSGPRIFRGGDAPDQGARGDGHRTFGGTQSRDDHPFSGARGDAQPVSGGQDRGGRTAGGSQDGHASNDRQDNHVFGGGQDSRTTSPSGQGGSGGGQRGSRDGERRSRG